MEIRVLYYFLTVAHEQSITKASKVLHITQPTLSRQLAELEEELQTKLFERGSRKITLTNEGILLRRRAEEILEMVAKTKEEILENEEELEGTITIGCGELSSVNTTIQILQSFLQKNPKVKLNLLTSTASLLKEQIDKGLVDIGLVLGNVDDTKYDFIRLPACEKWVVLMQANDPLAKKESINAKDLLQKPIILPRLKNSKNTLKKWFGTDFNKLNVQITCDLSSNAAIMVNQGMGYYICVEGFLPFWDRSKLTFRPLIPPVTTSAFLIWKKNAFFSPAVRKLIEYMQCLSGIEH